MDSKLLLFHDDARKRAMRGDDRQPAPEHRLRGGQQAEKGKPLACAAADGTRVPSTASAFTLK